MVARIHIVGDMLRLERRMNMDMFQKQIQLEIMKQKRLLEEQQQILKASPEGFLFARKRKLDNTYYHQRKMRDGRQWKTIQMNINEDPAMQDVLLKKKFAEKLTRIYTNNIPLLEKMNNRYLSASYEDIQAELPPQYDQLLKQRQLREMEQWMHMPYKKCPYHPEHLTHRTAYGEYVRSKGEVVIANALYSFGIPFHTEEELIFNEECYWSYYPDFKILLPDYSFIFWEHWGLLDKEKYRKDNAKKLFVYHEQNLILGSNLIITNDDKYGNCHSDVVYDIIEKMILPHFEGIELPRRTI